MTTPEPLLRRDLVHWISKVGANGWVANHDGNATVRLPGGKLLATPTAMLKGEIRDSDLLVLGPNGRVLSGRRRPFSELSLHQTCYAARLDVGAVLHAHPPFATAFAVAHKDIDPCIIAEAIVSLGDRIPSAAYALPGAQETTEELAALVQHFDGILLRNHGVLTVGVDLEQAFARMELIEHLARIHHLALPLGGARPLPKPDVERLLHRRTAAGLGPAARALAASGAHP